MSSFPLPAPQETDSVAYCHLAAHIMQDFPHEWRAVLADIAGLTLLKSSSYWQPQNRQDEAVATLLVSFDILEAIHDHSDTFQLTVIGFRALGAILVATLLEAQA